jgi:hypothetical protein
MRSLALLLLILVACLILVFTNPSEQDHRRASLRETGRAFGWSLAGDRGAAYGQALGEHLGVGSRL